MFSFGIAVGDIFYWSKEIHAMNEKMPSPKEADYEINIKKFHSVFFGLIKSQVDLRKLTYINLYESISKTVSNDPNIRPTITQLKDLLPLTNDEIVFARSKISQLVQILKEELNPDIQVVIKPSDCEIDNDVLFPKKETAAADETLTK